MNRVLLLEKNKEVADIIARALADKGRECDVVDKGTDLISRLKENLDVYSSIFISQSTETAEEVFGYISSIDWVRAFKPIYLITEYMGIAEEAMKRGYTKVAYKPTIPGIKKQNS